MQGFPGAVQVTVHYVLTHANELITEMHATTGGLWLAIWSLSIIFGAGRVGR
jgi:galactose mutarotase-like enzyme